MWALGWIVFFFSHAPDARAGSTVDHQSHFSEIKNQGLAPTCWAYTAASLLEEHLCLEKKSFCGQAVSVMDAGRYKGIDGFLNEKGQKGGSVSRALMESMQGGVCLEKEAPYKMIPDFECRMSSLSGESCMKKKVMRWFQEFYAHRNSPNFVSSNLESESKKIASTLPKKLRDLSQIQASLLNSNNAKHFLRDLFLTNNCKTKRLPIRGVLHAKNLIRMESHTKLALISRILHQGRSVAIALDTAPYLSMGLISQKGDHALIIDGLRTSRILRIKEVHLRNSHGKGFSFLGKVTPSLLPSLDGWKSAQQVMDRMVEAVWLTKR